MTRRGARLPRERQGGGAEVEVVIAQLGGRGDGIARLGDQRVFVPLTLPGDRLTARLGARREGGLAAEPVAWHERAPRAAPRCPHFGACGGCQLQHLTPPADAVWRCAQVEAALARRGLGDIPIFAPASMPPASRRRARIAFERRGHRAVLGFRARSDHALVDVEDCALVRPEILTLLPPLRALLADLPLAARGGELRITVAETGVDLVVQAAGEPGLRDRESLAAFADREDLARVSWQGRAAYGPEVIAQRRPVRVAFGGIPAELPPGAFLQATADAETQIRAAAVAAIAPAIGRSGRLADLFAGCGTFALPLAAAGHRVEAFELQGHMVEALNGAARTAGLGASVAGVARDLGRAPLTAAELDHLDAAILDPPRAGAQAQAQMLARSSVERIAIVSCNPASFARDARILTDGGYRLTGVQLIDAFLWSARIELVATLCRPSAAGPARAKFGA